MQLLKRASSPGKGTEHHPSSGSVGIRVAVGVLGREEERFSHSSNTGYHQQDPEVTFCYQCFQYNTAIYCLKYQN